MKKEILIETVVADILTQFMFTRTMDDVMKVWKQIYDAYELCDDPFTGCPVSRTEHADLQEEYTRQLEDIRDGFYL